MDEQAQKIEYNVHDDFRFPVALLFKAYWILENHGYEKFRKYVAKVNMPNQDIERVMNKYQYQTDPKFKIKIDKKLKDIQEKYGCNLMEARHN